MQECDTPGSFLFELVQSCASVLVYVDGYQTVVDFNEITPDEQYDGVMQVAPSLVPRAWPPTLEVLRYLRITFFSRQGDLTPSHYYASCTGCRFNIQSRTSWRYWRM